MVLAFAKNIGEMVRRGDFDEVGESLKGYWKDKKTHPWHRIFKELEKRGSPVLGDKELPELIILLRDAVFGALDAQSLSLALNLPTRELLDMLLKEKSWKDGRRKCRAHFAELIVEMIEKRKLDYLIPRELKRDGFGFLVSRLLEAQLQQFEKARPQEKDGEYDLTLLHRSVFGRKLLRELQITERKIKATDPRVEELVTSFEHMLLDKELEISSYTLTPEETAQVTLNGELLEEVSSAGKPTIAEESKVKQKDEIGVQPALTEYIKQTEKPEKSKKTREKQQTKKTSSKRTTKKSKHKSKDKSKNGGKGKVRKSGGAT